jgi:hypothetical protein
MATLITLPVELKSLIFSFCDYPTIVTLLRVNSHLHTLVLPIASNHGFRLQFILDYEASPSNRIYTLPIDARQTVDWHEDHQALWRSRKMYICFVCEKLRLPEKFAQGQCWRMMLREDYSSWKNRFCIDCGIKTRRYTPGSMIQCYGLKYRSLLCGGCWKWTPEFYCMREKMCFLCTEKTLQAEDAERFVEGFDDGAGTTGEAWFAMTVTDKIKHSNGCPTRPPCCRSCGDVWRYSPSAFSYSSKNTWDTSDKDFHVGYKILGKPKLEMFTPVHPERYSYMDYFRIHP